MSNDNVLIDCYQHGKTLSPKRFRKTSPDYPLTQRTSASAARTWLNTGGMVFTVPARSSWPNRSVKAQLKTSGDVGRTRDYRLDGFPLRFRPLAKRGAHSSLGSNRQRERIIPLGTRPHLSLHTPLRCHRNLEGLNWPLPAQGSTILTENEILKKILDVFQSSMSWGHPAS